MFEDINLEFPVTVYGKLEKYNDTISKGRCRIFYKGGNRNGTYITDEFAEKLLSTVSYAPVKGIYDDEEGDFTDHGKSRNQGRIYGIVPENPNITWEEHLDEDGVTRTYACVDVLIFTGLYTEAHAIVGKSQSMELYVPSIKGDWKIINGKRWYVFESAHFLGLQALGDTTTPCFEGAAFFALYQDLKKMVDEINEYSLKGRNGGNKMLNYKLSDNAKFNALWSLLNVNYCEAGNWTIEYDICEIYDEYAVVRNYSEGCFERIYYIKNDETDSVEITNRTRCFIMDVTEAEKTALLLGRQAVAHPAAKAQVGFRFLHGHLHAAEEVHSVHLPNACALLHRAHRLRICSERLRSKFFIIDGFHCRNDLSCALHHLCLMLHRARHQLHRLTFRHAHAADEALQFRHRALSFLLFHLLRLLRFRGSPLRSLPCCSGPSVQRLRLPAACLSIFTMQRETFRVNTQAPSLPVKQ